MSVKLSIKLILSALVYFATINHSLSDVSPYTPPFLRAMGNSISSPNFNIPQPAPQSSGSLVQDNSIYSMSYGGGVMTNEDGQDALTRDKVSQIFPGPDQHDILIPGGMSPSNNIEMPVAPNSQVAYQPHMNNEYNQPIGGNDQDLSSVFGVENNHVHSSNDQNMDPIRVNRPQLRQLDLAVARNNPNQQIPVARPNPAVSVPRPAPSNSRPGDNRRSVPNSNSRRNTRPNRVSEGHRLITRALWRIFDALMERNEKAQLTERMIQVETAVRNMEIPDPSKLGSMIEMLKEENMGQDQRLLDISRRLDELPILQERLEKLENWQLTFGQNDEELPSGIWEEKPAYSSCPAPFETVEGECFYLGGTVKRNWHDARRDCSKHGADLASPRQLSSLQTYLQSLAYQPEYVWVGASRQGNGEWVWSAGPQEGVLVDRSAKTWNDDLPSGLGNCMGLYEGSSYRAYDFSCVEQDLYVCQFFL